MCVIIRYNNVVNTIHNKIYNESPCCIYLQNVIRIHHNINVCRNGACCIYQRVTLHLFPKNRFFGGRLITIKLFFWFNLPLLFSASLLSMSSIVGQSTDLTFPIHLGRVYTVYPSVIILYPSSLILIAAFISLSCFVPQTGHTHERTFRSLTFSFLYPQQLQVCELA